MQCPVCQALLQKFQTPGKGFYHRCFYHGAYVSELYIERLQGGSTILKQLKSSQVTEPPEARPCAYCQKPMPQKIILGSMPVEHCAHCRLVWFDRGEVEAVEAIGYGVPNDEAPPKVVRGGGWDLPSHSTTIQAEIGVQPLFAPQSEGNWFASSGLEKKAAPGIVAIPLILVMGLITANLSKSGSAQISHWLFYPNRSLGENGVHLLTAGLAHADLLHFAGNAYFLWIFMDDVEQERGPEFALGLFVLGIVGGHLLSMFAGQLTPTLGASGGVFAIMTYFTLQFPTRHFNLILGHRSLWGGGLQVVPLPAWIYFGAMIVWEFWLSASPTIADQGINHVAHVGGALVGFLAAGRAGKNAKT